LPLQPDRRAASRRVIDKVRMGFLHDRGWEGASLAVK